MSYRVFISLFARNFSRCRVLSGGARTLLEAPGIATNKKLLGAPGLTTRSKDATTLHGRSQTQNPSPDRPHSKLLAKANQSENTYGTASACVCQIRQESLQAALASDRGSLKLVWQC